MMIRMALPMFVTVVFSVVCFSCSEKWSPSINLDEASAQSAPGSAALAADGLFARIDTSRGEIIVRLEFEKTPLTVCNFTALAEGKMNVCQGKPFYDGLVFHRVIADFMIQGGDPLGSGMGGPGYQFPDEIDSSLRHSGPGILSMANAGPGTNGSQFFITLRATPHLDGRHTVFGRVVEGMDVLQAIGSVRTNAEDRPLEDVVIKTVTIVRNGEAARAFKADQAAFDALLAPAAEAAAAKAKAQREAALAGAKAKRDADLAAIAAKYPNLNTDANGVQYIIQKEGNGAKPKKGNTVRVNYKGMFLSGEVFDASDAHGGPLELYAGMGQVIPGWDKTVLEMQLGEKRLVVLPPELAYGERGAVGVIPPNTFLVFEMELVEIK